MQLSFTVTLFCAFVTSFGAVVDKSKKCAKYTDHYIFACRSSDFECFKRQYRPIRDRLIAGCKCLDIATYKLFIFKYAENQCVRLSGFEQSTLAGIELDPNHKFFHWYLELPFRIQQIIDKGACTKLDHGGYNFELLQNEPLKKFTGNASIKVSYPYTIEKRNKEVYMNIRDENLDVVLDIPDFSHYNRDSDFEKTLYESSEWAFNVVKHLDAAEHFAVPYTSRLRKFMDQVPLRKIFQLYPGETFKTLKFKYTVNDNSR